jgi:chorismate mutase/prephenate dehydrogenase
LSSQDFFVEVADPHGEVEGVPSHADWRSLELDHELIVIAAPLLTTNDILLELARRPPRGVVFDIGSLKSPIRQGLRALRDAGGRVTSVHPMFGATAELLSSRHVVFVDVGDVDATAAAKALFAPTMACLVDMDLESHDRLIAYVLGLSHALNLAFLSALAGSGEAARRLAKLSSTTFEAQLGVARRVASENPHLYYEIQALNDYGSESLAALLAAVERIRSVVRAGDQRGFVQLMEQCDAYLSTRG